jgi:hypothetical protein
VLELAVAAAREGTVAAVGGAGVLALLPEVVPVAAHRAVGLAAACTARCAADEADTADLGARDFVLPSGGVIVVQAVVIPADEQPGVSPVRRDAVRTVRGNTRTCVAPSITLSADYLASLIEAAGGAVPGSIARTGGASKYTPVVTRSTARAAGGGGAGAVITVAMAGIVYLVGATVVHRVVLGGVSAAYLDAAGVPRAVADA